MSHVEMRRVFCGLFYVEIIGFGFGLWGNVRTYTFGVNLQAGLFSV